MTYQSVSTFLSSCRASAEAYVLVREVKVLLDVGKESYFPAVRIKVWHSNVTPAHPYHYTVSHHAHTPEQAGPYFPSRTSAETEQAALEMALESTTSFLRAAIENGHRPSDNWLVRNEDY